MGKIDHACQDQMTYFIFWSLKIFFFMTFQIMISKRIKEFLFHMQYNMQYNYIDGIKSYEQSSGSLGTSYDIVNVICQRLNPVNCGWSHQFSWI